jgi:hypothetical protein
MRKKVCTLGFDLAAILKFHWGRKGSGRRADCSTGTFRKKEKVDFARFLPRSFLLTASISATATAMITTMDPRTLVHP